MHQKNRNNHQFTIKSVEPPENKSPPSLKGGSSSCFVATSGPCLGYPSGPDDKDDYGDDEYGADSYYRPQEITRYDVDGSLSRRYL